MNYYILRNGVRSGPYDLNALKQFLEDSKILSSDIIEFSNGTKSNVRSVLKANRIGYSLKSDKVSDQLKSLKSDFLFPKAVFRLRTLKSNVNLILFVLIGLAPALIIKFSVLSYFTFYLISLYFSSLWALFYFIFFRTSQIKIKTAILVFFLTQFLVTFLVFLLDVNRFNPFYSLLENESIVNRLFGYIFGVGLFEEALKLLPLIFVISRAKQPLFPKTIVFYGLISGLAFGVIEGVTYQLTLNKSLEYEASFFLNIARLTTLPFLHSIWTAIGAYFLSFSYLFPKKRLLLRITSIIIPITLHGFYDVFTWSLVGLMICYLSAVLLIIYVERISYFQKILN